MNRDTISELARDSRGITSLEYTVLLLVIALGALSLWVKFGAALSGLFI
jgi:Flp pilus assembly pilin Flp